MWFDSSPTNGKLYERNKYSNNRHVSTNDAKRFNDSWHEWKKITDEKHCQRMMNSYSSLQHRHTVPHRVIFPFQIKINRNIFGFRVDDATSTSICRHFSLLMLFFHLLRKWAKYTVHYASLQTTSYRSTADTECQKQNEWMKKTPTKYRNLCSKMVKSSSGDRFANLLMRTKLNCRRYVWLSLPSRRHNFSDDAKTMTCIRSSSSSMRVQSTSTQNSRFATNKNNAENVGKSFTPHRRIRWRA